MASFRKRVGKRGVSWTATIDRVGFPEESHTFPTKGEAQTWATRREAEINAGRRGQIIRRTVKQALERYSLEVAPTHRGARWEQVRLNKFAGSAPLPFLDRYCDHVQPRDIAAWRDNCLQTLAAASVRREMVLLRSVFEAARRDWGWLRDNPMADVTWPKPGKARCRRVSDSEIDAILAKLGYQRGAVATNASQRIAVACLWAVETAMRSGELLGLRRADVSATTRVAHIDKTKNDDARDVPLTRAAAALLDCLPESTSGSLFDVSDDIRDALFRKARDAAGLVDLHFHDIRAEALTRLSRKVDVLTLSRIAGHRDLKSLSVYYRETASEIAARLD